MFFVACVSWRHSLTAAAVSFWLKCGFKSDVGKQRLELRERRTFADTPKGGEDAKRERAVRKTIQLLIKHGGGDGDAVKKESDISYRQGSVWKGETQLAEGR